MHVPGYFSLMELGRDTSMKWWHLYLPDSSDGKWDIGVAKLVCRAKQSYLCYKCDSTMAGKLNSLVLTGFEIYLSPVDQSTSTQLRSMLSCRTFNETVGTRSV